MSSVNWTSVRLHFSCYFVPVEGGEERGVFSDTRKHVWNLIFPSVTSSTIDQLRYLNSVLVSDSKIQLLFTFLLSTNPTLKKVSQYFEFPPVCGGFKTPTLQLTISWRSPDEVNSSCCVRTPPDTCSDLRSVWINNKLQCNRRHRPRLCGYVSLCCAVTASKHRWFPLQLQCVCTDVTYSPALHFMSCFMYMLCSCLFSTREKSVFAFYFDHITAVIKNMEPIS